MKTLIKGFLALALLLVVSPTFAIEVAHTGSAVLTPAPEGSVLGILQEGVKSQIIAALLAWFLGAFGIHRFYLGYKKEGTRMLILGLLGLGLEIVGAILAFTPLAVLGMILSLIGGIILLIDWIMSLIDFIKILTGDLKPVSGDYTETL